MIEAPRLGKIADRVIMGYLPPPLEYMPAALKVVKEGGIIHYESLLNKNEDVNEIFEEVQQIIIKHGRKCMLNNWRIIKSYAPNIYHVRLDLKIE